MCTGSTQMFICAIICLTNFVFKKHFSKIKRHDLNLSCVQVPHPPIDKTDGRAASPSQFHSHSLSSIHQLQSVANQQQQQLAMRPLPLLGPLFLLLFFLALPFHRGHSEASGGGGGGLAETPPRGWNSYDSYSWIIDEEAFLQNAEVVSQRLLKYGYEYVVVDFLWYRKLARGSWMDAYGFDSLDEWGRVVPDPERWPSSRGGRGFVDVARKVHDMGLKFGIHAMRGISTQAVNSSTPILDITTGAVYEEGNRKWNARDIGMRERACAWMPHGFMSVNTDLGAGRAFLRSLYRQYADWGVDFVKLDCVFGEDLDAKEIMTVSEILREQERPILLSLSPGARATTSMAEEINTYVNMYRVTGDDWDSWNDVVSHFNVSRDFASSKLIGAEGLSGRSWPDLDMLPLGWLTDPGANQGPHRRCNLNLDEQRTQMTLWSMVRSPLVFGGDLKSIDESTFSLITNPILLEINSFSTNNMEFPYITSRNNPRSRHPVLSRSAGRSLGNSNTPDNRVLGLTSCKDLSAKGWVTEMHDRERDLICWKDNMQNYDMTPFCLRQRKPLLASDEEIIYKQQYQGNFHLLATEPTEICLDASSKKKITSSGVKSSSLSPCKWSANQMWELNDNGTLVSSYSGLCATVKTEKDVVDAGGVRSWVATGRRGEIYLAFFNLNPMDTVISANIEDLAKVLNRSSYMMKPCKCSEIWSGKDLSVVKQELSMPVRKHGCALFLLICN